jgi:F-box and WD-40 domain protein CDC4
MLKREESAPKNETVGFEDALERFGRKRLLSTHAAESVMMEGVESNIYSTPPRKRVRGTTLEPIRVLNSAHAGPPSPLPSPGGSPPAEESMWNEEPLQHMDSDAPIHPDLSLTTLMALPNLVSHFSLLPAPLQSHVLLTLIRHSPLPVIRTVHSVIVPSMARDFLTLLPPELTVQVLGFLPYTALCRASKVCKTWRSVIDTDPHVWGELLKSYGLWFGGVTEEAFVRAILARRNRLGTAHYGLLPPPHPLKILFKSRHLTRHRWIHNQHPRQLSFQAHGNAVVTCLLLSHGRIISASDDHSIQIYSPKTGELIRTLQGHSGGVWALAATRDTLVSGSTDRTVRIWDLETGRCKHVFGGHSSTVRCLAIIKPEWLTVTDRSGKLVQEKWPKRPLIVTGSRDHTLRVWDLPRPNDREYRCFGADEAEGDPADVSCDLLELSHRLQLL